MSIRVQLLDVEKVDSLKCGRVNKLRAAIKGWRARLGLALLLSLAVHGLILMIWWPWKPAGRPTLGRPRAAGLALQLVTPAPTPVPTPRPLPSPRPSSEPWPLLAPEPTNLARSAPAAPTASPDPSRAEPQPAPPSRMVRSLRLQAARAPAVARAKPGISQGTARDAAAPDSDPLAAFAPAGPEPLRAPHGGWPLPQPARTERPRLLSAGPLPQYSARALGAAAAAGDTGRVVLRVQVDASGGVMQTALVQSSGYPALDRALLRASRDWRFAPAAREGRAVAAWARVALVYRLSE